MDWRGKLGRFLVLADLRAEGMTDYVDMPMISSDRQINALNMATDHPSGFTTPISDSLSREDFLRYLN